MNENLKITRNRKRHAAFTLTELLVAIGLLAIIMLAVSTVFRSTGDTVSAGLAAIEMNRRLLTAQTTLAGDIVGYGGDPFELGQGMWPANADPNNTDDNPPFIIIRNQRRLGFFDRAQWVAEGSPASAPNDLEHLYRTDVLAFFARGTYKRQTGGHRNANGSGDSFSLTDKMLGLDKAYIWYGHLRLPNNAEMPGVYNPNDGSIPGLAYYPPGVGNPTDNPNNYFANQWILGRVQIALVQPVAHPTILTWKHFVPDLTYNGVYYYGRGTMANGDTLTPLSGGQATCGDGSFNGQEEIWESRYDIAGLNAGLTWADYADIINTFRFGGGSTAAHPDWVSSRFGPRFRAHPFALGYAADEATFAAYASQQVPIFLPGCTQFIVEFAGDYVSQDANGNVTNTNALDVSNPSTWGLDGVIDYDVVTVNGNQVRQIHWYGYPRKTDGTNKPINVRSGDVTTVSQKRADSQDVVTGLMPFEFVPDGNTYDCGWTKDMLFMQDGSNPPVSLAPKLIRITVTITDPEGRMRDGMTRQFIFPVKHVSY